MIDPDKCNAAYHLHHEGMPVREISRRLNISRNTVRRIIKQKGVASPSQRKDKTQIDRALLERLYRDCKHWSQRVHEKLVEEEGIEIGYSTLTRLLGELGITKPTLLTSNLGFSEWSSFLKNKHLTAALIDRLTENSHVINMKNCKTLRGKLDDQDDQVKPDASEPSDNADSDNADSDPPNDAGSESSEDTESE